MKRFAFALIISMVLSVGFAQDLAGTIAGLYGESIGATVNVDIPEYGRHAVVTLVSVQLPAVEARDVALPVFRALAAQIGGNVSASIHAREGFGSPVYVLVLQSWNGEVRVFLDGQAFD